MSIYPTCNIALVNNDKATITGYISPLDLSSHHARNLSIPFFFLLFILVIKKRENKGRKMPLSPCIN